MPASYFIVLPHSPGTLRGMNTSASIRPEERRRCEDPGPGWADTVPAWFRSEAFAEDLADAPEAAAPPRLGRTAGKRVSHAVTAQSDR